MLSYPGLKLTIKDAQGDVMSQTSLTGSTANLMIMQGQKVEQRSKVKQCVCSLSNSWKVFRKTWKENHAWPVFYSTLVVSILSVNFGITLGYASPAIPT